MKLFLNRLACSVGKFDTRLDDLALGNSPLDTYLGIGTAGIGIRVRVRGRRSSSEVRSWIHRFRPSTERGAASRACCSSGGR